MTPIDVANVFALANTIAGVGFVGGLAALYHFQFRVDGPASLKKMVPLFCCTFILFLLTTGFWYSGPVWAVSVRIAIVLLVITIEVAVANPLCFAKRLGARL